MTKPRPKNYTIRKTIRLDQETFDLLKKIQAHYDSETPSRSVRRAIKSMAYDLASLEVTDEAPGT